MAAGLSCDVKRIDAEEQEGQEEIVGAAFALVFMTLLAICFMLGALIQRKEITWLPEAGATMMVGMLAGGLMLLSSPKDEVTETLMGFSPEIFMVCMLPPIIFDSGYKMKARFFFKNMSRIMSFAFLGTFLSTWIIGLSMYALSSIQMGLSLAECLTFGSLISATDPVSTLAIFKELGVDLNLYYTVLGESVFNDAVAIVLFRTFGKFVDCETISPGAAFVDFLLIFVASTLIGIAFGLLSALLFKYGGLRIREPAQNECAAGNMNPTNSPDFRSVARVNNLGREEHFNIPELAVCLLFSYIPFLFAEAVQMSGIVAILFTGITMRHYTRSNLSLSSQQYTDDLYHLVAHVAETAVFLNLGLSVFSDKRATYHAGFIISSALMCLLSRAMHIYPLSIFLNRCIHRDLHSRLQPNEQHMIWFSGLRGAIAFACASEFPGNHRSEIQSTTMVIVLFTVFCLGGTTVPMLRRLRIQCHGGLDTDPEEGGIMEEVEMASRHSSPGSDHSSTPQTSEMTERRTNSLMSFDAKYIKPIFSTAHVVDSPPSVSRSEEEENGQHSNSHEHAHGNMGSSTSNDISNNNVI